MAIQDILEKAKSFHLADDVIQERELARESFVKKFPIDKIKDLTIDQFVQGTDGNSFCYWLEFNKIGFGIGGGNASKFDIYRTNIDGKSVYVKGFGKKKIILSQEDANSEFEKLKSQIILALDYVKKGEIDKIRSLNIPMWPMVTQKILSIYYPDKFLTIGSSVIIIKCAKELGLTNFDLVKENLIQLNFECKNLLTTYDIFIDWSYEKIGTFIWEYMDGEGMKKSKTRSGVQYWVFAPGANANMWDEFHDRNIMGLGWDELGDLSQYEDRDELRQALIDLDGDTGSRKNDVSANDDFLNKMKIGDVVIVKKGVTEILGYGVVESEHIFDDSRPSYKNIRKVSWKISGSWKDVKRIASKTLTDISSKKELYTRLLETMVPGFFSNQNNEVSILQNQQTDSMKHPLNTIFYGPPGTGKTYHTVLRAAEIIENRKIEKYEDALKIFKENLGNRIEFITFHQNYSYEDFIQGLRPDTENDKILTFEKRDGVFKTIADRGLENLNDSKNSRVNKKPFEEVFDLFFNPLLEGEKDEIEVKMKKVSYNITSVSNKSIDFRKASGGTAHTLSIATLKKMYAAESLLDIRGLGTYYSPLLTKLIELGKTDITSKEITKRRNYVIVIDEINRANISRVFGELITLIEPDKRSDGDIPMTVTLPSGDSFMVPSNLYIIGTMNTADKSIALLDIALRRRFNFEPMYPQYNVDGEVIHHADVLKKLNDYIVKSKGHDFQIGHAYFMGENSDLMTIMNQKVIPLLMEYFMNDSTEVEQVLKSAGLKIDTNCWPLKVID